MYHFDAVWAELFRCWLGQEYSCSGRRLEGVSETRDTSGDVARVCARYTNFDLIKLFILYRVISTSSYFGVDIFQTRPEKTSIYYQIEIFATRVLHISRFPAPAKSWGHKWGNAGAFSSGGA